jgi:hypothetical protein
MFSDVNKGGFLGVSDEDLHKVRYLCKIEFPLRRPVLGKNHPPLEGTKEVDTEEGRQRWFQVRDVPSLYSSSC